MFLVDDLLFRPFVSLLNTLHSMAIEELHDVDSIRDELKENRLLHELGERSEAEYRERRAELEERLAVAEAAHENLQGRVEVKR
ncbi:MULTISPECIES: gas vesicle protein GvpG [unclassified Halorubrum]|uniref:gas vesicle protein GvpG n=1 Tax=unclassified Halorubrum TaxID=2642239 RepID=UPI000B99459B|nr:MULTISPECIES: protein gvpG [unclassified Halorubrum]OYR39570.1 protein gvpG [Halorubrum sp. Hd13]OYR40998.1 protein gvpG [Halorubrum sp. Eb13]OYR49710.1 protein gvpG [Halorubrum sp. Ea8]OYR51593.1 protein gvpG [Halorubrum sp. Ea1]